ncbi:helix-turn-helix domain-containing protein [Feifania hominis]|uniref:Helix-turn-helix domain-containing protein n=1 Tax=Feifania hominis TaxID=2763660 RepID=A0A926HUC6_9FIRM|nr:XRE family transcriptional regulator [Feifania hominis]MBC8535805.1 helix-turn-helix domain-containing protein [Feifania hominis]
MVYLKRKHHLTTAELSAISGVPVGTLNKLLCGAIRNPATRTLTNLANALGVTVRYLIDDTIDTVCEQVVVSRGVGTVAVSADEVQLLRRIRALSESGKRSLELLLDGYDFCRGTQRSEEKRQLFCYIPVANGHSGIYVDAVCVDLYEIERNAATAQADFLIKLVSQDLEPLYPKGTLLAVKEGELTNGQLGVFLLQREGYVGRYQRKGRSVRIVSLNGKRKITVGEDDEFRVVGRVLGAARNCTWIGHSSSIVL